MCLSEKLLYRDITNQVKGNFKVSKIRDAKYKGYYFPIHKGMINTEIKIPHENLKKTSLTHKVGDKVRIKTKEQFAKDFKIHYANNGKRFYVQTSNTFSVSMNSYCGREFIIEYVGWSGYILRGISFYSFDSDMFMADRHFIYKEI